MLPTPKKKRNYLNEFESNINLEQLDKTHLIQVLSTLLQTEQDLVPRVSKLIDFINCNDSENVKNKKNWNEEFQVLLSQKNSLQKFKLLFHLAHDFVYAAGTYAKIIISEQALPLAMKTIKPTSSMGGIAGGKKYIVQNMLFKFVLDFELRPGLWMYGGSESNHCNAMKAASLELKGLSAYHSCDIEGLHFPLMAIIDYKGYRVLTMSILPINDKTIKYGSSDAGSSVHADIHEFNHIMATTAQVLNLKPHVVGFTEGNRVMMHAAGDIEGHFGTDSRFYLIDFARAFPPEGPSSDPSKKTPRQEFFKMLRPEFVRSYKVPLCPDGFTNWQKHDPMNKEHNRELLEATAHLKEWVIPEFAANLDTLYRGSDHTSEFWSNRSNFTRQFARIHRNKFDFSQDLQDIDHDDVAEPMRLIENLHRRGINVRHLGLVRGFCREQPIRKLLLLEMLSRVIKDVIHQQMRDRMIKVKVLSEEPFNEVIVEAFAYVCRSDSPSACAWWEAIRTGVIRKFDNSLLPAEQTMEIEKFTENLDRCRILDRIVDLVGVKLTDEAIKEYHESSLSTFELVGSDIVEVYAKVKHMNIVDYAEGMALSIMAVESTGKDPRGKLRLLRISSEKFLSALRSNPNNFMALYQWAKVLMEQAEVTAPQKAETLYKSAIAKLKEVISLKPSFEFAYLTLGIASVKCANCIAFQKGELSLVFLSQAKSHFSNGMIAFQQCLKLSYEAELRESNSSTSSFRKNFGEVFQVVQNIYESAKSQAEVNKARAHLLHFAVIIFSPMLYATILKYRTEFLEQKIQPIAITSTHESEHTWPEHFTSYDSSAYLQCNRVLNLLPNLTSTFKKTDPAEITISDETVYTEDQIDKQIQGEAYDTAGNQSKSLGYSPLISSSKEEGEATGEPQSATTQLAKSVSLPTAKSAESYAALKKVQEIRKYVEDGVGDEKERVKKFQKGIAYHQTYDEEDSLGYENSGYENGVYEEVTKEERANLVSGKTLKTSQNGHSPKSIPRVRHDNGSVKNPSPVNTLHSASATLVSAQQQKMSDSNETKPAIPTQPVQQYVWEWCEWECWKRFDEKSQQILTSSFDSGVYLVTLSHDHFSKHTYRVYINPQLPMLQVNNVSTTERGVRRIPLPESEANLATANPNGGRTPAQERTLTSAYSSLEERRINIRPRDRKAKSMLRHLEGYDTLFVRNENGISTEEDSLGRGLGSDSERSESAAPSLANSMKNNTNDEIETPTERATASLASEVKPNETSVALPVIAPHSSALLSPLQSDELATDSYDGAQLVQEARNIPMPRSSSEDSRYDDAAYQLVYEKILVPEAKRERRAIEKMAARPDVMTEDDKYYWDGSSSNELKKELTSLIEQCTNEDKFEMTNLEFDNYTPSSVKQYKDLINTVLHTWSDCALLYASHKFDRLEYEKLFCEAAYNFGSIIKLFPEFAQEVLEKARALKKLGAENQKLYYAAAKFYEIVDSDMRASRGLLQMKLSGDLQQAKANSAYYLTEWMNCLLNYSVCIRNDGPIGDLNSDFALTLKGLGSLIERVIQSEMSHFEAITARIVSHQREELEQYLMIAKYSTTLVDCLQKCFAETVLIDLSNCYYTSDAEVETLCSIFSTTVTKIDLRSCMHVTDVSLKAISKKFVNLEEINLSCCCRISDLGIQCLTHNSLNLSSLIVEDCVSLSNLMFSSFAGTKIQKLNCKKCQIDNKGLILLAESNICAQITHLYLGKCGKIHDEGIKALATAGLPLLLELDISGCSMISTRVFLSLVAGSPRLHSIDLGNSYKIANDGLFALANANHAKMQCLASDEKEVTNPPEEKTEQTGEKRELREDTTTSPTGLSKLVLCNCKLIDADGFASLARVGTLSSLDLSRNQKFLPTEALLKIFRDNPLLTEIDLSENPKLTSPFLAEMALQLTGNLTQLSLDACGFVSDEVMLNLTRKATGLTSLSLAGCNRISHVGVKDICALSRLQTLNLARCRAILDNAVIVISHCTSLTDLNVSSNNSITNRAILALAGSLSQMQKFNVSHCNKITCDSVVEAIKSFKSLEELNVENTKMQDVVVYEIVKKSKCIKSLNFSQCSTLTSDCLISLAEGAPSLTYLNLKGVTKVSDSSLKRIARFLPSLTYLDIEGCHHVSDASMRLLRNRPFLKLVYPSILQAELNQGIETFQRTVLQEEEINSIENKPKRPTPTHVFSTTNLELMLKVNAMQELLRKSEQGGDQPIHQLTTKEMLDRRLEIQRKKAREQMKTQRPPPGDITKLGSMIANEAIARNLRKESGAGGDSSSKSGPVSSLLGAKSESSKMKSASRTSKTFPQIDSPFEAFQKELLKRRKAFIERDRDVDVSQQHARNKLSDAKTVTNADAIPTAVEQVSPSEQQPSTEIEIVNNHHVASLTAVKPDVASDWISNPRLTVKERIAQTNEWASINANNPLPSTTASCSTTATTASANSPAYTTLELSSLTESTPSVEAGLPLTETSISTAPSDLKQEVIAEPEVQVDLSKLAVENEQLNALAIEESVAKDISTVALIPSPDLTSSELTSGTSTT